MAQLITHQDSAARTAGVPGVIFRLRQVWAWLRRAVELSRQRRALYRLDEGALHDLGLSRADAWQEADKPFWRQPAEEGRRRSC
ncbi:MULTISPECIES: DUF1127 domain-containing protein [unclassified Pseudomonas]|uniref:DUF1127 domain-containing protein n=1 Tax=unclassified Pseudomonas TaxID=196821 RepID=UPI00131AFC2B|nr:MULTISPECIES: DUF1127 domain-containing protein [unclassified Pseudomonas]